MNTGIANSQSHAKGANGAKMRKPRITVTKRHTGRIYLGMDEEAFLALAKAIDLNRLTDPRHPWFEPLQRIDLAIKHFQQGSIHT